MELQEIPKPVGAFILENIKRPIQTENGMYVHYEEVCTLLKKYRRSEDELLSVLKTLIEDIDPKVGVIHALNGEQEIVNSKRMPTDQPLLKAIKLIEQVEQKKSA